MPYLLCHDAPVGDWFFCACGRAHPSSTGFPSISASPYTSPAYVSPSLRHTTTTTTTSSSVLSHVLSCKNWFSVLSEEILCNDPLDLGCDDVPVASRRKRHCILAAGISPIIPESRQPDLPYKTCTNLCDNMLLVKLLSPHAKLPTQGSGTAAGYDLYSSEKTTLSPKTRKLVDTGIAITMNTPKNLYARIASRSGLSVKALDIGAGIIDADYRGPIKILLINNSNEIFQINIGDQMVQLILE